MDNGSFGAGNGRLRQVPKEIEAALYHGLVDPVGPAGGSFLLFGVQRHARGPLGLYIPLDGYRALFGGRGRDLRVADFG